MNGVQRARVMCQWSYGEAQGNQRLHDNILFRLGTVEVFRAPGVIIRVTGVALELAPSYAEDGDNIIMEVSTESDACSNRVYVIVACQQTKNSISRETESQIRCAHHVACLRGLTAVIVKSCPILDA